jgi:hypothetical protein
LAGAGLFLSSNNVGYWRMKTSNLPSVFSLVHLRVLRLTILVVPLRYQDDITREAPSESLLDWPLHQTVPKGKVQFCLIFVVVYQNRYF